MRNSIKRLAQALAEYKADAFIASNVAILQHGQLAARLDGIHALRTNENISKQ